MNKVICPQCGHERVDFTVTLRPDGLTRCCFCQRDIERVISAMKPKPRLSMDDIRRRRDQLLKETDHWELPSVKTKADNKTDKSRQTYRQRLRDMTDNLDLTGVSRLDDIVWPVHPDNPPLDPAPETSAARPS